MLSLLAWVAVSSAQEETPSPDPEPTLTPAPQYIVAFETDLYFPMAVRFYFDAILPLETEITEATLTLQSDSLGTMSRNVPIEEADVLTQDGVLVALSYFWIFEDADETPLMFEEVRYTWSLTLSNNETDVAQGGFVFSDHRANWETIERGGVPLALTVPRPGLDAEQLIERLRPIYTFLAGEAESIEDSLAVVLYTDAVTVECPMVDGTISVVNVDFPAQTVPCVPGRALELYERSGYLVFDLPSDGLRTAQQTLTPLLVQRAYAPLWEDADIPEWFQFGVVTLYRDQNDKGRLTFPARTASRNGQLFSLDDLRDVPASESPLRAIWEGQSYGLVVYMAEVYGLETVFELARSVNDEQSFSDLFNDLTGNTLVDLLAEWELWLFTDDAPNVYGVNLYLAATATPTLTPSITPVTPTRTPFPTFTPSDTPTTTATPLPPTETPTVTPRPARDVFTPTPTRTPTPETTVQLPVDPQLAQFALLGVAVLAVVLLVGGLYIGRRR
jgi:hypothetical protein